MVQVTHCARHKTTLARKHTVIVNEQTMHFQWVTYQQLNRKQGKVPADMYRTYPCQKGQPWKLREGKESKGKTQPLSGLAGAKAVHTAGYPNIEG